MGTFMCESVFWQAEINLYRINENHEKIDDYSVPSDSVVELIILIKIF